MPKSIQVEKYLDFIIIVSARKMQYLEYVKKNRVFPESKEYQEAFKNTIANMDNLVFLTTDEKQQNLLRFDNRIKLDKNEISKTFKETFKKMYPRLYRDFLIYM